LRQEGVFEKMEEDFRAKQTVKIERKSEKKEVTSYLGRQLGQNIGSSALPPASFLVSL
jgi:hypothetical protein